MDLKLLIAKGLKIILNPPALRNCNIDAKAKVCPKSDLTNVTMDKYSYVGYRCFILNTEIGSYTSIAERCCIGGESHPMDRVSMSPVFHEGKNILKKNFATFPRVESPQTQIGSDVWIGMGSYIKAGVKIGNGAVIGMGSVVTHDVPPYEVWAGVPAKRIKSRFDSDVADRLLASKWWELDEERISELSCYFDKPEKFLEKVENIK